MLGGQGIIETICAIAIYIMIGRQLSQYYALHRVRLSPALHRALFWFKLETNTVSITGLLWQLMFIITMIVFFVLYQSIGHFITYEEYAYYTALTILIEWVCIGVPFYLYGAISERILRRQGKL